MTRLIMMIITLLVLIVAVVAVPLPSSNDTTIVELEKRVTHSGQATWFTPGLGHCGYTDSENDPIAAMSEQFYDQNGGSNCNQWIAIKNTKSGKTTYAKMRDSCPGCGRYDLDLSPAAFKQLGSLDTGVLPISWHFQAKGWSP